MGKSPSKNNKNTKDQSTITIHKIDAQKMSWAQEKRFGCKSPQKNPNTQDRGTQANFPGTFKM